MQEKIILGEFISAREYMRGLHSHSREYAGRSSTRRALFCISFAFFLVLVQMHATPVFAPARIQENIRAQTTIEDKAFHGLFRQTVPSSVREYQN